MKPKGLAKALLGTSAMTAALVVSFIAPSAHAATENWTGATNGLWSLNTNWSGSTTPTSADDLTILGPGNVAGALNINVDAASAANSINFTNTAATTLTNTTSGANQTLTLGAGGLTTGTGAVTIGSATANQNVNIALGASQIWNVGSGGLTATNVISGTGFGLTKTGTGTLVLSGVNTYTGGTTISAGTLQLNATTGAANAGAFTLASGTTLKINQGGNNFGYGATLNLTGDATINNAGGGAINQTGTVTGNSHALTINSDGNRLYMNGTMSGITQFNVTKGALGFDLSTGNSGGGAAVNVSNGASLWVVNSTVTSTNNITLNGGTGFNSTGALFQENSNNTSTLSGTVTLNSTSSIGVGSATGTILLSGKVTGAGGLTKIGAGTLTLSNSTNNYAGPTTINQGTLNITGNSTGLTGGFVANANGNAASTLTLNGNTGSIASNAAIKLNGGIFNYQHATAGGTFDASGFAFSGGDRTYQSTYGTSGNAVLNLANATRTAGTTNNYTTSGGTNGTTNKITFTSAPSTGVLVDKGDFFNGASYLAYDVGGYARAYDYSTDANGATSTGGATLGSVTGKNVDLTTAAVTAQTTDSINTLRLGTTNGVAITAANTLSVDGILKSGGNAATISGGSIQAVSSGGEMVLRSNASTDTLTITSVIANNGTSSLTTSGLGTIALNAANTYAGGTKLGAGIVTFNNNASFGTGTITSTGGALIRNTAGVTTTNNLVVNGATTLDASGGNWNLNGNISGSGDITRGTNAALSLYLGGDNSGYTGTFTVVNNGNAVVRFNAANSGSAGASWVFNNATAGRTTLSYGGTTGVTSFGSMTGSGVISSDTAGTKTISAGALNLNDTFSGTIANATGTIALTKVGSGTMTLSGTNTYTGITTLGAGALSVATIGNGGVAGNLGQATNAAANLVFDGGALQYTGATASTDRNFTINTGKTATFDVTTNNLTVSGASTATNGALTKIGNGTLTLSGANAYTGQTTVSGGTLSIGAAERISNSSSLLVNGGAFDLNGFDETVAAVTISSGSLNGTSNTLTGSSYALQGGSVNAKLGAGAITVSTGTTTLGSAGRLNSSSSLAVGSGQLSLGGNESVASYVQTGGTLGGSGQTLTSAATFDLQAGTVNANLGGSGIGLTKSTGGTVTLAGANTYTGATNVTAGQLTLTGSVSSTAINVSSGATYDVSGVSGGYHVGSGVTLSNDGTVSGAVTVDNNGTLKGSGTYGAATVNGTLAVGNSPGQADFSSLTLAGTAEFEIGGLTRGSQYDAADVSGLLTYGGALNVISYSGFDLVTAANFSETPTVFDLFGINGSSTGSFGTVSVAGNSLVNDGFGVWNGVSSTDPNVTYSFSQSTGDLSVTVVPEPGAALLGGLGMLALLRRRRVA